MKIALINENSQAAKNEMICATLKSVVEPMGHEVFNYGMYSAEDTHQLTYVQNGILAAVLLNSGAADFVITGCGTGEGAMLACNAFPQVLCGHIESPLDAYLFSQVNDGNCIALPFAENFGWGGELNLTYIFEKLFCSCQVLFFAILFYIKCRLLGKDSFYSAHRAVADILRKELFLNSVTRRFWMR